jgi:hypothetical protein
MPKTILLHIGTGKTGTTSIQNALVGSRRALTPVCYPRVFGEGNHNRLLMLYLAGDQVPRYLYDGHPAGRLGKVRLDRYRRSIFGQLASARSAIISGESLSATLTPVAARHLRSDLESVGFKQFQVILYIRDPADFFLSLTQQRLRSPTSQTELIGVDASSFTYKFRRIIDTWEEVFPGDMVVRKFPGTAEGDVVEDFSALMRQYLGVALPAGRIRNNTTISAEAMQILQNYRSSFRPMNDTRLAPDVNRLVRYLEGSSTEVVQNKPVLRIDVAESIRARHKSDADFVFSRYGVDLGLSDVNSDAALYPSQTQRVEDLLETVDRGVIEELLLRFAHSNVLQNSRLAENSKRSLPLRVAARVNQALHAL